MNQSLDHNDPLPSLVALLAEAARRGARLSLDRSLDRAGQLAIEETSEPLPERLRKRLMARKRGLSGLLRLRFVMILSQAGGPLFYVTDRHVEKALRRAGARALDILSPELLRICLQGLMKMELGKYMPPVRVRLTPFLLVAVHRWINLFPPADF